MKSEPMDPYKVLGVSRTASLQEIKKAYRIKARKHHPDHGGDAWAFEQTNEAYKHLLNPTASSSTAKKPEKPEKPKPPKKPDVAPGDQTHNNQTPSGQPNQPSGWNQTSAPPPFAKAVPQQDQAQQPPQSTPPDLGWNASNNGSDGAFDFGATEDNFQRRQKRRKKNSILPTLIGSLVGGLSAILCAGWILSIVNPAALHEFRDVPLIGKFLLGADEIDPAPKPLPFDPTVSVPTKEAEPEAGVPSVAPLDLRILNDAAIKMVEGSPVLKATFSIKNRSDKAISNYTGGYRLINKGRTHAYIQGDFKEKIPGGIEPGETLNFTLKILPNKSERKIKTWSEGSQWEIWLDRAWANKKGYPVPKTSKGMKQIGF